MNEGLVENVDLLELLRAGSPKNESVLDTSALRYVLYARKSTSGDERQERSIDDQINECLRKVVIPDKITLVQDPIKEQCSAKDPDIRPKFKKLLNDIKSGKIDGIISWHPDRLSRNMREAGEIIDLLDKGVLKDLRFATSNFDNTPTGKMLLGISFVLSKQYSEHLSESVQRGNKSKTEDGYFIGKLKHGYYVNNGRLFPDGDNFILIKEAFRKRLDGVRLKDIADWLNESGYTVRRSGENPVLFVWNVAIISKLFKDPVYAGVLSYGENYARLSEHYDFEAILTEKEFLELNKVDSFKSNKLLRSSILGRNRETTQADLLRGMVYCGHCNKKFSSGLVAKDLKEGRVYYYNYRCETEGCLFKGKSLRANVVLKAAIDFLEDHLFTTKENYENFKQEAVERVSELKREYRSKKMSLTKILGDKKSEYEQTRDTISKNPGLAKHYDLDELMKDIDDTKEKLDIVNVKMSNLRGAYATYEEYLELFESLPVKLRESSDMEFLDKMLRLFFSNFMVKPPLTANKQGSIVNLVLKEPWQGFVNSDEFFPGRASWTMY